MRTFSLLLLFTAVGCTLAAHGDVLVSSSFHFGQDGWSLFGPGDLTIGDRSGMLFAGDKGKTVWYFSAPSSFIGDKCFAYNGILSFRLGHSEYMSNGKDMIQDWDVILESKVWDLRVGQRNVIPAWVGASNHELSLNERAGWVNMRSGHAPTTTEMLRLFTSLSGIFIRGGYYDGHEETWIDNVVMKEGDHKADALLRQVEKHARHPSERVVEAPPPAEEVSTPKYSGVLRSKAAIAAHMAREAAFQAAKQAHEEEQARIAEEERQAVLKQEAEVAARLAEQQEAAKRAAEEKASMKKAKDDKTKDSKTKPSVTKGDQRTDNKSGQGSKPKDKADSGAGAEAKAKEDSEDSEAKAAAEAKAKADLEDKAAADAKAKQESDATAAAEARAKEASEAQTRQEEEIAAARAEYLRARAAEAAAAVPELHTQQDVAPENASETAASNPAPVSESASAAAADSPRA